MARPAKPADALIADNSASRRTKAEINYRKQAEEANLTGRKMQEPSELKADRVAHLTFLRTRRLLEAIGKDDELYLAPTQRYCVNTSKLAEAEKETAALKEELERLREGRDDMKADVYYTMLLKLENSITSKEKFSQSIRKELFDYEKENCMTVAASLRSIPKKPPTKTNALKEALSEP